MRMLLSHAAIARRALKSAELPSRLQEAACVQGLFPAPFASSVHCLHGSAAAFASEDDSDDHTEKDSNGEKAT